MPCGWERARSRCPVLIHCLDLSLACRRAGRPLRGTRAPSAGEMGADDAGMCSGSEASTDPMSTGNEFLDKALVLHLNNCNRLLLVRTRVEYGGRRHPGWAVCDPLKGVLPQPEGCDVGSELCH